MSDTPASDSAPPQTPPPSQRSNSAGSSGTGQSTTSPAPTTNAASDLEHRIIHSALLMRGRSFIKFGRTGRPHLDVVRLSVPAAVTAAAAGSTGGLTQGAVMMWGKKSVPISELVAVTPGRVGPVFERFDAASGASASELDTLSALSFSMVFTSRSLDLQIEYVAKKASVESVARGEAERNAWVAACKWLLATSAQGGAAGAASMPAASPAHHGLQTPSPLLKAAQSNQSPSPQQQLLPPSTPSTTTPNPFLLRAVSQPSTPNPPQLSASAGTPPRNPDFSSASHLDVGNGSGSQAHSPLQSMMLSPSSSSAASSNLQSNPVSPAVGGTRAGAAAISSSTAGASTPASAAASADPSASGAASSGISRPLNVTRTTHVQSGFLWQRERLDQDFQLVSKLGEGAFAEVWLGQHKVLGFSVAVKMILLSSDAKRAAKEKEEIADEIAVLRLCRNKFICGYVGCCLTPDKGGRIWILMDYYSRGSILNLTFQAGMRLNESQISFTIHSVLMGLIYLNSRNICHRDVKGRNILVNQRGEIALADFGVSKILRQGAGAEPAAAATPATTTTTNAESKDGPNMANIAGSPCFMAPEVVSGSPASFAADIWSVGITCLELANGGRVPHDDLTTPYRIFRAIKTTVPTLDWVPTTPLPSGAAPPPLVLSPTTTPGGGFSAVSSAASNAPAVWSHSFHDFVRLCLDPNPATRSDAVSLLSHPFVSGSFSPAVMAPILKAFDAAEHKKAKAKAKQAAIESKQQAQAARPPSASAASSAGGAARSPARPSILDSLFKFLGRKGPTSVQAKMQVQILQGAGTLDEMDEPAHPASAGAARGGAAGGADSQGGAGGSSGGGGVGDGTVVMNGGSDTMIMGGDSFSSGCTSSDTDDEDDMHTATTSLAAAGTTPSISIAPSPASSPMATAPVMMPEYAATPEFTASIALGPAATIGAEHPAAATVAASASPSSSASIPTSSADPVSSLSSSSLSLPHVDSSSSLASPSASTGLPPSGLGHHKSHSNSGSNLASAGLMVTPADVLLKCSAQQLAALCHEVGIDSKLASALLARITAKYAVANASASSPSLGARRGPNATVMTRRQQQQQPQQQSSSVQSLGRASPLTLDDSDDHDAESPPSLFPGCTPNLALSESLIAQLEYSTVNVCGLSRNDLTALKRMTNAPAPVRMAIESVALVLGVAPYHVGGPAQRKIGSRAKPVYDYWSSAQNVLTRPNFLTQLKSFDFRQLSPLIIDRLHEFGRLQPKEFTPEVVASASMPAGVLWAWTRSIYSYATNCLGYTPAGVAIDLANGNGALELNALTLPANEEVITAGTIAAAGAAGTASNSGAIGGRSIHTASTLSLLSPSAAQAGKLNRRGSAGALDPAVMAAATKLAAASAAAAAGGGGGGGSTHRRGTGGHGSQPMIVFSAAASLLSPTAAVAKDSVGAAPAPVMPLASPVSAPAGSGSSSSVSRRGSLGSGAKLPARPLSAASAAAAAASATATKPAVAVTKAGAPMEINISTVSADAAGASASSSNPATPATPSTDATASAAASPAPVTAVSAASKPKKTATGEVLPVGSARRKLSHGGGVGGGGGAGGSGRSLLVPGSGAATARSTSASRAPKSGSASHKKPTTTTTTTAAANSGAATTRDRGSSASAASSSSTVGKRNSLPPTHSKTATAASSAATAAAPKKP